jgi:hypothetical protein
VGALPAPPQAGGAGQISVELNALHRFFQTGAVRPDHQESGEETT